MSVRLSLKEAVDEIFRTRSEMSDREPFFLIIGAGLSVPSIPTASELQIQLEEKYNKDKIRYNLPDLVPPSTDPIDLYSFWFEKAFPQPIMRRDFLKTLMQGKPPTPAMLRLAHLLISRRLSSLVITPNFDDLLSTALLLFGTHPIVSDHPETVSRIEIGDASTIKIAHVHGSFQFYDCCNLRGEITEQSQIHTRPSGGSMAFFLNQILNHKSPILIGYSGWDHDVILTALKQRLKTRPASHVYWFCHTVASYDRLSRDITDSDYVRFILPEGKPNSASLDLSTSDPHTADVALMHRAAFEPATLQAVDVLDALNERFEIDEPMLTQNPFEHLALRLEATYTSTGSAPFQDEARIDHYDLHSVVRRLRHAAVRESEERVDSEKALERIRTLIRRSNYKRAVIVASDATPAYIATIDVAEHESLREFVELFRRAVSAARTKSTDPAFESLMSAADTLIQSSMDERDRAASANARLTRAKAFTREHQHQQALEFIDAALSLLDGTANSDARGIQVDALLGKGVNILLTDSADPHGYEALDEVIKSPIEGRKHAIYHAYNHKADFLNTSGDPGRALSVYSEFISRFGMDEEARDDVIATVRAAARMANRSNLYDEALRFVEISERLLKTAVSPQQAASLRATGLSKAQALNGLGQSAAAILALEQLDRLDDAELPKSSQLDVMRSLARMHIERNEFSKARDYYSRAISTFEHEKSDYMKRRVAEMRDALLELSEGTTEEALPAEDREDDT